MVTKDIRTTLQMGSKDMLFTYRKEAHLTQQQLANAVGVSTTTIGRIERHQPSGVTVHTTTSAGLYRVIGENADEILKGVTITANGKPAGGDGAHGRPTPRDIKSCDTCGYVLPLTNECDFCETSPIKVN